MKNCGNILNSLGWCYGKPSLSGIRSRIYVINAADIVTYPDYERDELGRPTSAVLKGEFTTAADVKWKYIDHLPEKGHLQSDPQGEPPSQTQLNKITLVHPGVDDAASAIALSLNNSNVIALVVDMDGRARVIGSQKYIPKWTVTQDNGEGVAGTTATTIAAEVTAETPAPFYVGTIDTEEGEITFV